MENTETKKDLNIQEEMEISNLNLGILIRTEALNMISNILNSWFNAKKPTKKELEAIQTQIDKENEITKTLYNSLVEKLEKVSKKGE